MTKTRIMMFLLGPLLLLRAAASVQANFDACSLITRAEIEAVQGEPVTGTRGSAPQRPLLAVSQCFYTLATFSRSVSLEVARRDPRFPAEDGPRAQWNSLFHPAGSKEDESPGTPPEREKESSSPLPVKGVGEEAFWMGNAITGGLYVLNNDAYVRISLGGPAEITVKIEKAKTLARKAITRLRSQRLPERDLSSTSGCPQRMPPR